MFRSLSNFFQDTMAPPENRDDYIDHLQVATCALLLEAAHADSDFTEQENDAHSLEFFTERFWRDDGRTKLFGVTVSDGAYEKHTCPDGKVGGPNRIKSRFMAGDVVDLVAQTLNGQRDQVRQPDVVPK